MIKLLLHCLALMLFILLSQNASAEFFEIESFHSDIQIQQDSSMIVTERIVVEYTEPRHGLIRDIDTAGIETDVLSITNVNNQAWPYEVYEEEDWTQIKIGDPNIYVNGQQIYEIRYQVHNAIRRYSEEGEGDLGYYDELYWNVNGNEWPVNASQVSATITVPKNLFNRNDDFKYRCFTGYRGSDSEDCSYQEFSDGVVQFQSNGGLSSYQGLTIVLGMPPDRLELPGILLIKAEPKGANIYLNDELKCQNDCEIFLKAGGHILRIEKWGYTPFINELRIAIGESLEIQTKLSPLYWFRLLQGLYVILMILIATQPAIQYWRKGRDPKGSGSIVTQYEHPDDLIPAEMGALYDEKVHLRDLTSTIIDLCVRGYLKIEALPKPKGLFKKNDYKLIKTDPKKIWQEPLTKFENLFIKYLFDNQDTRKLSSMRYKFYTHIPKLNKILYRNLVEKKYMPKSPEKVRSVYMVKAFLMLILTFFTIAPVIFYGGKIEYIILLFSLAIHTILSFIFAPFMPQKTKKGRLAYEHILGFKVYLETSEKDRLKFQEQEHLFYKFLPYAMTLKVADKWSKAFEGIFKEPPNWYMGAKAGIFSVTDFSNQLNNLSTQISGIISSTPKNHSSGGRTSGSGFSGGSSGGGFGGGGGKSW